MQTKKLHFEMIGQNDQFYCYFKIVGDLTHNDYEMLEKDFTQTLQCVSEPKVKLLVDVTEFTGWDIQAAWDDLKFGLQHNSEFSKIAIVGESGIREYGVTIANWFTKYEMQYFTQIDEAKKWLEV